MMIIKKSWVIFVGFYALLFYLVFENSLSMLYRWWGGKDYSYCYLILPVFAYMVWEKRNQLRRIQAKASWFGLLPLFMGVLFFWLGELGGEYYTLFLSSWLVLVGLLWIHMGWDKLKIIWFPIVFLITMYPLPKFVYNNLSMKLKLISSQLGVNAMQLTGMTAYREGNVIDLGFTQLQVVDACNGLRYLFPLIVLAILVAYFSKSSQWKKFVIVLSAIPISILINGIRIASVGMLYPIWGPQVAEGFFHDFSGWAIFMISLGILLAELWVLQNLKIRRQSERQNTSKCNVEQLRASNTSYPKLSSATGLKMFSHIPLFIVAFILLSSTLVIAQTVEFREKVPIGKPFSKFPMRISSWKGQGAYMEQKFIDALDFNDYILVNYTGPDERGVSFYSAYYESQRKGESIHSPSSCLPAGGWVFHESGRAVVPVHGIGQKQIIVNRAFMQKGDYKQLIYYWFPMRGRIVTNIWEIKLFNFWDALTRQRTDGALVRLITPVYGDESVGEAEGRLQTFLGDILPVLDEFLPK